MSSEELVKRTDETFAKIEAIANEIEGLKSKLAIAPKFLKKLFKIKETNKEVN